MQPSKIIYAPSLFPNSSTQTSFSVHTQGTSSHWNTNNRDFKIVLPFLHTTRVLGYDMSDLHLMPPIVGENWFYSGNTLNDTVKMKLSRRLVEPAVSYDYSGRSVSIAGDINGDGYDDLIIGVPYAARCYVLFGTAQGFVNMTQGFTIFGAQQSDLTGWSVSGAGDVNNDTFADIVIGAPAFDNIGAAFIIYGKDNNFTDIKLSELTISQGFIVLGSMANDYCGVSVSGAGDVNNDGFDDVFIGVLKSSAFYHGAVYVVYGAPSEHRTVINISPENNMRSDDDFSEGFVIFGTAWSYTGYSVSYAGDVNNDNYSDILVGSVPKKAVYGEQISYILYGKQNNSDVSLSSLNKQQGVVISGGGVVVSGVGDINHDGYDDIMIGNKYGFDSGGGFVVFSPAINPWSPTIAPSAVPSAPTKKPQLPPTPLPTVLHSGPSYLPTEPPTGPTSTPTSTPTITSEKPSTSYPTYEPSTVPTIVTTNTPTTEPSIEATQPSLVPTMLPIHRTRHPVSSKPSITPTLEGQYVIYYIVVGGTYHKSTSHSSDYTINTNETVTITGHGSLEGDIYTVLPQVNGSLHIEIFNNVSDKLNLTSHNTIHSMSDLVITSGSVIINFLTTGQRIRLANLTPLEISENNFMFSDYPATDNMVNNLSNLASETRTAILAIGATFGLLILVFVVYVLYYRIRNNAQKIKFNKECQLPLEDNPTRLTIAVNDMYAHFDAYIPHKLSDNSANNSNKQHNLFKNSGSSGSNNSNNSSASHTKNENKSDDERSPLSSFEKRMDAILKRGKIIDSSGSISLLSNNSVISNFSNVSNTNNLIGSFADRNSYNSNASSNNSSNSALSVLLSEETLSAYQSHSSPSLWEDAPSPLQSEHSSEAENESFIGVDDDISLDSDMVPV